MQSGLALYKVDDSGRNGTQFYHRGELVWGDLAKAQVGKGESRHHPPDNYSNNLMAM